jgi:hypothetical protein
VFPFVSTMNETFVPKFSALRHAGSMAAPVRVGGK